MKPRISSGKTRFHWNFNGDGLLKDSTISEYSRLQKFLLSSGASYALMAESDGPANPVLINLASPGAFSTGNLWLIIPWDLGVGMNLTEWIRKFCEGSRVQPNLILIVTSSDVNEEQALQWKREVGRRIGVFRADQLLVFGDPQAERKLAPLFDPAYAGKFDSVDLERTAKDFSERRFAEVGFYKTLFERTPKAYFTTALVITNALIYVAMVVTTRSPISFTIDDLLRWGANYGPYAMKGEWWRLLTSAFIHVHLLHIVFNMWCLWNLGALAERFYGNNRFLIIYLLSALGGSITSVYFHPQIVSAGASGAVFGISGSLVAFLWKNRRNVPAGVLQRLKRNMIQFIGFNILFGLVNPSIDNAAHMGGLITGCLAGALFEATFGKAELSERG